MSEDNGRGRKLPELDREGIDGENPMAERGPEDSGADVGDCEYKPGERSAPPQGSEFSSRDELDEAFPSEELATPIAADGLPDHSVAQGPNAEAHPFTYESVCCIEDDRAYVELFDGEIAWRGDGPVMPRQVGWERGVDAQGRVHHRIAPMQYDILLAIRPRYDRKTGEENQRHRYDPHQVTEHWGKLFVKVEQKSGPPQYVAVRPVREQCVHYRRQHFANDEAPLPGEKGHNIFYRLCTHPARRSIGGAAMSLRDEAIYGCDFRQPFVSECNRFIDAWDHKTLKERPHLTRLPMFNLAGDDVRLTDKEQRPS